MCSCIRKICFYIVNCSCWFFVVIVELRVSCFVLEKMVIFRFFDMDMFYKDFMIIRCGSVDINKDMVFSLDVDLDIVMDYVDELDVSLSGFNMVEEMRIWICMYLDFMELKGNLIEKVIDFDKERF